MKSIDLFCASPASTAICSSMDQRSIVRHGTRPINRHGQTPIPCSSELPIDPKPYYQKNRKSSAKESEVRTRSSADILDPTSTPPCSSRYLLSNSPFVPDSDHVSALVPSKPVKTQPQSSNNDSLTIKTALARANESDLYKSSSTRSNDSPVLKSSSTRSHPCEQVVELRVSIHCKGCEGKLRKHISRMEGVRSFSIDLSTKKVTVIGDVTPLAILTSISRVKNAQFWPCPSSSSSSSPRVGLKY